MIAAIGLVLRGHLVVALVEGRDHSLQVEGVIAVEDLAANCNLGCIGCLFVCCAA